MLTLTDLRKTFGSLTAVDGVSLQIERGEVFGLLGPNGAGKSTTIGMCMGLLRPDSGSVTLDGLGSPTLEHVRASIGVAPQSLALYDDLTARENLIFFGKLYGLRGGLLTARVDEVLTQVGLLDRAADRAGTFSGGMKRRLNLAAAVVHDPPLVMLDEPTAGVDPQSRNNILDMVRAMAAEGKTVVYTTHYMEEAQKLCSRVGIIDKGKILAMGTVDELISRFGGQTLVTIVRGIGDDAPREEIRTTDPAGELRKALTADGNISAVHVERPDLEAVFLSLTGRRLRD